MELPTGIPDPIFTCELALELGMTVAELTCGRGTPMSAHEFGVLWPAFYRSKRRVHEREQEKQTMKSRGRR
jgi:hypothetical protein